MVAVKGAGELAEAMGDFMHSHVRHCGGSLGDVKALAAFEAAEDHLRALDWGVEMMKGTQ